MKPWSSFPPNMRTTARGFRFSMTSRTCVNQLKTSGRSSPLAIRPSIASAASTARFPATSRSTDSPGTTTRESPAIHRRSFFSGVNFTRSGGLGRDRRRRLRLGRGATTAVSTSSSSDRPSAALRAARGRSSSNAPLTLSSGPGHAEGDVALPPLGLDRGRLLEAGRVEEEGDQKAHSGDDDRRPCRVQAAPSLRGAAAWAPGRCLARLHQNWK